MDAALQTAETVLETVAPIALATASATNPNVAAAAALVPIALQLLQAAQQMQRAGAMSQQDLAALFATVGQGVQASHTQWAALNASK